MARRPLLGVSFLVISTEARNHPDRENIETSDHLDGVRRYGRDFDLLMAQHVTL
jgi:hypothetical protein